MEVGLIVAILAGWEEEGALETTNTGGGMFWEGTGVLVEGEGLFLPLPFLLVTVVKGASSTTSGLSTTISTSGDSFWGKLGP